MKVEPSTVEADFVDAWPPAEWCDLNVVLAVSGGPDSVAMLRAAVATKLQVGGTGQIVVAHLNHEIRIGVSAADEAWLADLCHRLDVPIEIGRRNVPALAAEHGDGLEAAARAARYDFLRDTAERRGARFVAVAHTADDQVETVVHRLIRGTGLAGLAGMPRTRPLSPAVALIRPLLAMRRADLLRYLAALGQDYLVDATNSDDRFTRNRLRNTLLPMLRSDFNPDVDNSILRVAQQAEESQRVTAKLADGLFHHYMTVSADRVQIDCWPFASEPSMLVRESCKIAWIAARWPLQDMTFEHWRQLSALIQNEQGCGSLTLPGNVQAERVGEMLLMSKSPQTTLSS